MAKHEARLLKKELMKRWPDVEFSVIGGRRSWRNYYTIHWKAGPTIGEVERVCDGLQKKIIHIQLSMRVPECG